MLVEKENPIDMIGMIGKIGMIDQKGEQRDQGPDQSQI